MLINVIQHTQCIPNIRDADRITLELRLSEKTDRKREWSRNQQLTKCVCLVIGAASPYEKAMLADYILDWQPAPGDVGPCPAVGARCA